MKAEGEIKIRAYQLAEWNDDYGTAFELPENLDELVEVPVEVEADQYGSEIEVLAVVVSDPYGKEIDVTDRVDCGDAADICRCELEALADEFCGAGYDR